MLNSQLSFRATLVIVVIAISNLSGCVATAPQTYLPANYAGETAIINDTFVRPRGEALLFGAINIDENETYHIVKSTADASRGNSDLIARSVSRAVPAQRLAVTLIAQRIYAIPIVGMFSDEEVNILYSEVYFSPQPNQVYLVNGRLSGDDSDVWIEDAHGNIVSAPINGDSVEPTRKVRTRVEQFLYLKGGESAASVVNKLGQPERIQKHNKRVIYYEYEGLGRIRFSVEYGKQLFIYNTTPVTINTDDVASVELQLLTSSKNDTRHLAKGYFAQDKLNQKILDVFAKEILRNKSVDERLVTDATAWWCKVLGKSKNPRYRSLLEHVSVHAAAAKLRKYAKLSLEQIPWTDVPQFSM